MTLVRELIDIPERVHQGDFVLRLAEGLSKAQETLRTYVVTPELAVEFDRALGIVKAAVAERSSKAAYLHGSFGSGKSHFMAVLHLLLQGNPEARAIPELGSAVAAADRWISGKKFLLVPFHMIGAKNLESAILGGYARHVGALHPEAAIPGVYVSEALLENARAHRKAMGDEAFFRMLGGSAEGEWGELGGGWTAETFEAAAVAPPESDERVRLVGDLTARIFPALSATAAATGLGFVELDLGLSLLSKHARGLGYDGIVLFLDELILWLASHIGDLRFAETEGSKLVKLIEAGPYERPIPIVSFVARQRDLKELVGAHVPGAERLSFADTLNYMNDRFAFVRLEDRNLPAIVHKRVLKPRDEAARIRIDDAFRETERFRPEVLGTLLGTEGDRAKFRTVYPFSPALVDTLVAVSSLLQRERTALKLLLQLLVDKRDTLELGQVVPVGDLFDVLASGAEPFSAEMRSHFDEALRLYRQKLLPAVAQEWGLTPEQAQALPATDPKGRSFRGDDRIVKTLLLAALAPDVAALTDLTAAKLCALNHGSIKAPVEGREAAVLLGRIRKWAAQVGALRVSGESNNPTISIVLSRVDIDDLLERERAEDNAGNRRRKLQELLFERLGIKRSDELFTEYPFLWRNTDRAVEVYFTNIREMPDESLRAPKGGAWKVLLDFPFDPDHGSLADDLKRIELFRARKESSAVLCWLPAFLTAAALEDLGKLVVVDHILAGERFQRSTQHLSEVDRGSARGELESLQAQLRARLGLDLEMAYGIRTDADARRVEAGFDPSDHVQSLDPAFQPRPPVGATLKDAFTNLLDQAMTYLYPDHPRFEKELRPVQVKQVLEELRRAAGEKDGRIDVPQPVREAMRNIAMGVGLGKMYEAHFILERDWAVKLSQVLSRPGVEPTVKTLRAALDEPRPKGLPKDVQDLILCVFAEQTQRSFLLHGGPFQAGIGNLRDELVLKEQPLPPENIWTTAVERASLILGVTVPKFRSASNVATLVEGVRAAANASLSAAAELARELEGRLAALGLPVAGARLETARAGAALLKAIANAREDGVAQALALASVPGSGDSLSRSIRTAAQVVAALQSTKWQLLEACRSLPDARGEAGRSLIGRVAEALQKDELAQAIGPILSQAEDEAVKLLAPPVVTKPTPPVPPPAPPEPAVPPTPPVQPPTTPPDPTEKVVHAGSRGDLTGRDFRKVADDIQKRLDETKDGKLKITWEITGKG